MTLMKQLAPAATLVPQVLVLAKSLALVPVIEIPEMLTATLPFIRQCDRFGQTFGVNRLVAEVHARGGQLYVGAGAFQCHLLRTALSVVGDGNKTRHRAYGRGLEGDPDGATGARVHRRAAGVGLGKWSGRSNAPDGQDSSTGVGERHRFGRAGGEDHLGWERQTARREGDSG